MDTAHELTVLEGRIAACQKCELFNIRTRTVPGNGPPNADIFIIGEAPGSNENSDGNPFIGAAGNKLNSILVAAGLSRGDCFVTNMVKCWPGEGNPDPTAEQIAACDPWLEQQLRLVRPRGIITFGRFSTGKFMEFGAMGKVQGVMRKIWWDDNSPCYVMPIYHPAYLRRSPEETPEAIEHLKRFKAAVYGV